MSLQPPSLDNLRIERSSKPETAKGLRLGLLALLAVVLVAGVMAVVRLTRPTAVAVRVAVARPVTTAAGGRTVLNASGYVTARREATVSSKVSFRPVSGSQAFNNSAKAFFGHGISSDKVLFIAFVVHYKVSKCN